jgi:hypothetical protein
MFCSKKILDYKKVEHYNDKMYGEKNWQIYCQPIFFMLNNLKEENTIYSIRKIKNKNKQ